MYVCDDIALGVITPWAHQLSRLSSSTGDIKNNT